MKILITGGAGFVGYHLAEYYLSRELGVRSMDRLQPDRVKMLTQKFPNFEFMKGSITNRGETRKAMKGVDVVFHLAAAVSVNESISRPGHAIRTNLMGTINVVEEAISAGVRKIVFASSSAVYGSSEEIVQHEDDICAPINPYGISKLAGEHLMDFYQAAHGIETVCLRFFNIFGPGQNVRSQYAAVVPSFICRALRNQDIQICGDGSQTRDFIYVTDIVSALDFAGGAAVSGVYNVGGGKEKTINELAHSILDLTESKSKIVHVGPRVGEANRSKANIERIVRAGWKPMAEFETAILETKNFYLKRNK